MAVGDYDMCTQFPSLVEKKMAYGGSHDKPTHLGPHLHKRRNDAREKERERDLRWNRGGDKGVGWNVWQQ